MDRQTVAMRIDKRIAWYRDSLERMEACHAESSELPCGPRFVRGLGQAVYRAALRYLEDHRETLLDELPKSSRMAAE